MNTVLTENVWGSRGYISKIKGQGWWGSPRGCITIRSEGGIWGVGMGGGVQGDVYQQEAAGGGWGGEKKTGLVKGYWPLCPPELHPIWAFLPISSAVPYWLNHCAKHLRPYPQTGALTFNAFWKLKRGNNYCKTTLLSAALISSLLRLLESWRGNNYRKTTRLLLTS